MLRTFINFMKTDYNRVRFTLKDLSNNRIPDWAIALYWSLLAPICLLLYPIVKLACWIFVKMMIIKIKKGA